MLSSVTVRTANRCRAYPGQAQQAILARTFGCVRVVWNRTLAERHRLYHAEGENQSYAASGVPARSTSPASWPSATQI